MHVFHLTCKKKYSDAPRHPIPYIISFLYHQKYVISFMNTYFLYPFRFSIHYISFFTGASVLPQMYFSAAYYNALPLRLRLSFFPQCQQPQFILSALLCLFALPFSHSLIVTSLFYHSPLCLTPFLNQYL